MFNLKFLYPNRAYRALFLLLVVFLLLVAVPTLITYADNRSQTQEPPVPPDEDPTPSEVGDTLPILPQTEQAIAKSAVGGHGSPKDLAPRIVARSKISLIKK